MVGDCIAIECLEKYFIINTINSTTIDVLSDKRVSKFTLLPERLIPIDMFTMANTQP